MYTTNAAVCIRVHGQRISAMLQKEAGKKGKLTWTVTEAHPSCISSEQLVSQAHHRVHYQLLQPPETISSTMPLYANHMIIQRCYKTPSMLVSFTSGEHAMAHARSLPTAMSMLRHYL